MFGMKQQSDANVVVDGRGGKTRAVGFNFDGNPREKPGIDSELSMTANGGHEKFKERTRLARLLETSTATFQSKRWQ